MPPYDPDKRSSKNCPIVSVDTSPEAFTTLTETSKKGEKHPTYTVVTKKSIHKNATLLCRDNNLVVLIFLEGGRGGDLRFRYGHFIDGCFQTDRKSFSKSSLAPERDDRNIRNVVSAVSRKSA